MGKYLLWINADDLLLPGTLDRAREYLNAHPKCEWLTGNLIYIDEQDQVLWCERDGQWSDWLYRREPVRVYGAASIFRRDLVERAGGFNARLVYAMDTDLWLRFKAAGARFQRVQHYCWAFRVHAGSRTAGDLVGRPDHRRREEMKRICAENAMTMICGGCLSNGCGAWQTGAICLHWLIL